MPKKKKPEILKAGSVVMSKLRTYTIESYLGGGGFGKVYKVHNQDDFEKKYAMKVEYEQKDIFFNRLKVDLRAFETIEKTTDPKINKKHFVKLIDKGKTPEFFFLILELLSYSLKDIYHIMLRGNMSMSSAIKVGRQTLASIEALHMCGWIHRDIKPANFAIGRPPREDIIYMLDFGIAKDYLDNNGKHRLPRKSKAYLGTHQYASREAMKQRDLSRRDDYEVWCYLMLELFKVNNFPWSKTDDFTEIFNLKCHFIAAPDKFPDVRIPVKFEKIIRVVDQMDFYAKGDVKRITQLLDEISKDERCDESQPFEWIGQEMPAPREYMQAELDKMKKAPGLRRKKEKEDRIKKIRAEMEKIAKDLNPKDPKSIMKASEERMNALREAHAARMRMKAERARGVSKKAEEYEEEEEDSEGSYWSELEEHSRKRGRNKDRKKARKEQSRCKKQKGSKNGKKKQKRDREITEEEEKVGLIPMSPLDKSNRDDKKKNKKDKKEMRTAESLEIEQDAPALEKEPSANSKTGAVPQEANSVINNALTSKMDQIMEGLSKDEKKDDKKDEKKDEKKDDKGKEKISVDDKAKEKKEEKDGNDGKEKKEGNENKDGKDGKEAQPAAK